jgi:2-succinyl-5-enolpyruvyl-6-hydroxy-3-cyclohexene-1-carboxylate synthase
MKTENAAWYFVHAFVDELARSGVHHACICPGSRSTPLAMLLEAHPDIKIWMHIDERAAAFFALGMAKTLRQPVALVSTSGTAAANFLPAIVEARYARVPLLVLTADRPPELREVGANQTIDQINLYCKQVKWFLDVGLPEATASALSYIRTVACRALAQTLSGPAGPVHLNFAFREPLVPLPCSDAEDLPQERVGHPQGEPLGGRPDGRPYTEVTHSSPVAHEGLLQRLADELSSVQCGLIVCGPQDAPELPEAVVGLARALGYPVVADPLSQVRCGGHDRSLVIDAYDAFLRDEQCVDRLEPELVLRFGAMPRSKPILLYLQRYPACRQIVVDDSGGWSDPTLQAGEVIVANPWQFCHGLAEKSRELNPPDAASGAALSWQSQWLRTSRLTRHALTRCLTALAEPFEGKVFGELADTLEDGTVLFVGNSMPVRDLDTFFHGTDRSVRFLANHGASGIDGVLSSALGASAATSGRLVLVLGDLSFYHDLNGLLAAKLHDLDATIIVLNNDGGGIFSFLPQVAYPDQFETLFGTPHGLDFERTVAMFGGRFERVRTWDAFRSALVAASTGGWHVIEVPTRRDRNVVLHREVWSAVHDALEREFEPQRAQ